MANKEFLVRHGLVVATTTAEVASITATGITANAFTGNGVNLTYLSASQLSTGTVPSARMTGTYSNVTANNSSFLGGTAAASYQLNSTLAANVASLTAFGGNTVISDANGTTININSATGNTALKVVQRGTGDAFRVDDIAGDTTPFIIDNSGRMIQGHDSNLFVTVNWSRQFHGSNVGTAGTNLLGWGISPTLAFTYSTNSDVANGAAPTLPTTSTTFAQATRMFVHTNTDVYTEVSRVSFASDQTANGTAAPTALQIFSQNGTSTALGVRYHFASNGNFGIGQTSPTEKLHVVGNGLFTGNVSGVNGVYSGNVSGLNGVYSGNVSGVNGVYSGNVSGVNGVYSGNVSGNEALFTGNITAYYSDRRLKSNILQITGALELLSQINGVYYTQNDLAKSFGYNDEHVQVGVIAQEVQISVPSAVTLAPFDTQFIDGKSVSASGQNYLTVKYEKLVPLLIEAIKELERKVDDLTKRA